METPKATTGRIVHYVMPGGKHRPAIVVEPWNGITCNLQVFRDGANDGVSSNELTIWVTSVAQDENTKAENTWHWPERE